MSEIKTVIFDIGWVLVGFKPGVLKEDLFVPRPGKLDWNNEALPKLYNELTKGLISPQDFYKSVLPFMEEKIPFEEFEEFWGTSVFIWKPEVAEFIKQLKGKGYKIGLVSDCDAMTNPAIMKHYGLRPFVDATATSFELHRRKFEKELFFAILRDLNEKPENCIYIDDLETYVKMGKELGLKTILFKNLEQLKKELSEKGIEVN